MLNKSLFILGIGLLCTDCSKKSDPIPDNSIRLMDNGSQVVFSGATALVEVSNGGKQLKINASTSDNNYRLSIIATDQQSVETPRPYAGDAAGSGYVLSLTDYYTVCHPAYQGTQFYQFASSDTNHPNFQLVVKGVDTATHRISGTFGGTYYLGCDSRTITNGQFNLPYIVKP